MAVRPTFPTTATRMSVILRSDGLEARFTCDVVCAIVSSMDKCIKLPRAMPPRALFLIKSRLLFEYPFFSSGFSAGTAFSNCLFCSLISLIIFFILSKVSVFLNPKSRVKNQKSTPHASHLTPHTSRLTPHTSHLTPHTSRLTPHTSCLTPHTSPVPFPEVVVKFRLAHRKFSRVIIKPVHEIFFYLFAPLTVDLSGLIFSFTKAEVTELITQCSYF